MQETRWVIVGEVGLYTGQYLSRLDAIADHVQAKIHPPFPAAVHEKGRRKLTVQGKASWAWCRRKGDRAVKATISWEVRKARTVYGEDHE